MADETETSTSTSEAPAAPPVAPNVPPYLPPPLPYAPPPPAKGGNFKKGFGLGAGLSLGLALGGIVLSIVGLIVSAMMFGALISSLGPASTRTGIDRVETVWGAASAAKTDTVRAISIAGPITADASSGMGLTASTSGYEVANLLDSLGTDDGKGVVLLINTPGGTINGSKAIGDAVTRYQKRTGQKVIAYVRGMSASGGMYAMASSSEIIADHGTLVGSIGVIFGPFARYKDVVATGSTILEPGVTTTGGITQEYLTQGKGKDFGNPYRDMTAEERQNLSNGMAIEYTNFVTWVSENRKISADVIRNELGAYIFDPQTAKQKGLIDQVMGPDEAFRHVASSMGIDADKMRIVRPKAPSAFESFFGAENRIYGQYNAIAPNGKVTSVLCSGNPQALVVHGSLTSFCG